MPSSPLTIESSVLLNSQSTRGEVRMPLLGFGLWQSPQGRVTQASVLEALQAGYRLIDTAAVYGNEADAGAAIRESGLKREKIFVTTKLWNSDHGYDTALRAFDESLSRLGLDYVDLYLIHFPVRGKRLESWRALRELLKGGGVRAVGVSNFTVRHLQELLDQSGVAPAVNQVEFTPFLYQRELLEFCRSHDIVLQAYSPLTRGERLDHLVLRRVASSYKVTTAQVLLRWCLQHGVSPLPKSNRPKRIRDNAALYGFELSPSDMATLDGLNEDLRLCWDPTGEP